jgi:PKD repeat protein
MRRLLSPVVAAAVLTVACSDNLGPVARESRIAGPAAAGTAGAIAVDKQVGTLGERDTTVLAKGFNGGDPQTGDAMVATIFWSGTNTLLSVADFHTDVNRTPLNNTYHQVGPVVTAGGVSMATFVATNIQGFVPNQDPSVVYAVQATFSQKVTDGGLLLTAFSGVAPVFTDAMGASSSASGAMNPNGVLSDPGAISIDAGQVAYGVTMTNGMVGHDPPPAPYVRTANGVMGDGVLIAEGNYTNPPFSAAGTTDPQWNWGGTSTPSNWLAQVLALKPSGGTTNQPPVAAFTSSCSSLTCAFTSTSSDPDGTISSYSWDFGDGQTSTTASPSHAYGAAGSYTVTLTVTDNQGATNSVQHPVTVSQANQSPTAAFTSSCTNLTCNFTNQSSDPDGSIASSSWNFGDGQTSTAASPSHTYSASGTYTVQLTVTDNQGATNSVSHTVTVNRLPVAAFSSSCNGLACSFTNSSSDPDGSIASNSWNFGDGQTSTTASPSHTYGAAGTYTVTLTVTDNRGATNSVQHSVTVTAPNQPPVAAFSSSCSWLGCTFTSTSSDPDGSISAYSWTFGDGATSTAQNPSHTYGAGGTYTVTLKVTDNRGATNTVSHSVTVTAPNAAPVVNAGSDQTVLLGVLYTLNASFSDPDNGPWTYTINWGDGTSSSGSRSTAGSFSAGHTYLGLLTQRTIRVTVTDSRGASGSDTKVITLIL